MLIHCTSGLPHIFVAFQSIQEPGSQILTGAVIQLCSHSVISLFSIWERPGFYSAYTYAGSVILCDDTFCVNGDLWIATVYGTMIAVGLLFLL